MIPCWCSGVEQPLPVVYRAIKPTRLTVSPVTVRVRAEE